MYIFFKQYNDITTVMSEADDGNMRIRCDYFDTEVLQNRETFCQKNGVAYSQLISALTEHTANVATVNTSDEKFITGVDALVTNQNNIYLSVTSADCLPVVFYEPQSGSVGIAHAGWKGVVSQIVPRTISAMQELGAQPQNIQMEIGPGISQKNFDFGLEEMLKEFGRYNQDKYIAEGSTIDKVKINLQKIIEDQAVESGISMGNMHTCTACTLAQERFFSARRSDGASFDVMMAMIGIKSS